jgi:hypothetical protein
MFSSLERAAQFLLVPARDSICLLMVGLSQRIMKVPSLSSQASKQQRDHHKRTVFMLATEREAEQTI